jgi:hypothetical protein
MTHWEWFAVVAFAAGVGLLSAIMKQLERTNDLLWKVRNLLEQISSEI